MGYTFGMAQPYRKPHQKSESPSRGPRGPEVVANDNEDERMFEKELERDFGKGMPLEVHMKDIRAIRAFRNAFPSIKNTKPEDLNFYVINPGLDVAITRAFGLKDSSNIELRSSGFVFFMEG